ncbi:WGxxGxxG family protein [Streptomyces sp. NPDC050703]|uniref:WGxxGxxG family protein n=1 Tax=Streptomyces sp. NPDC050703 TaxID=3157218 RepID=UPI0034447973
MQRTTIGALLTAVLLAGPAAATAEAQTPVAPGTATVQAAALPQAQDDDNKDDDDGGGWGLWGLAGLLGLLGLIPRRNKTHDTGHRGTGGAHTTDRL